MLQLDQEHTQTRGPWGVARRCGYVDKARGPLWITRGPWCVGPLDNRG